MNRYTSVPTAIQTIHISVVGDKALLSITLPKETKEGLLYEYQTVECSYKKNSFLAQSKQITVDLKSQPALENIVNIQLTDLAPSTVYQCKVRLANRNGFGSWSKNMEISIKDSDSESESDSSSSSESTSEEEEKKEEVKKPSMREKAKQLASSATSPIKQLTSSLPTPIKQLSSPSSSSSKRSPSPKPIEEKPTEVVTPVIKQEVPASLPKEQPPTSEEILHWVEEGKLDKLTQLPASSLSSLHSPVSYLLSSC